ncbi:NHLP family bacteriocin export ABC transporter peptidase/permease/ATPase subunit [Acuticoccus kandeliae]|uniref:NHLP family bacteriocin export ABC transporter peptidase/permease/ATPase subunit n=1 Tax=Acuticoccus kandeliae TaxID=2073160 RepID=UPI0013009BE9|nr:NHLP family bacteriocin export ABC transporter peptidase/permease/ATPase subunit [Acuticoccus kandeliae]
MLRGRPRRVSTPTVLQMEATECGAAALGIVLGYYRRFVPLEELRETTGVSRDGVKVSHIKTAAEGYGLKVKALQLDADAALKLAPPFIVFWNENHFLVVEGRERGRVYLNDPAMGQRTVTRREFDDAFSGIALTFKRGPDFRTGGTRRRVLPALVQWTEGSRWALVLIAAISLLLIVPTILLPALLKIFVDEVLVRRFDEWLFPLVLGLFLAGILNGALVWFQQSVLLRLQMKFTITIATQFLWHMLRLPVTFFTQRFGGDIVSRVNSANALAGMLSGPMPMVLVNAFTAIFYVAVLWLFSAELTLIALALTAISLIAVGWVQRRIRDLNASLLNTQAKVTGAAMAGLQTIETIKAMGTENDFFRVWSGYQTNSITTAQRLHRTTILLQAVPSFLSAATTAAVVAVGALLIIEGSLSIGGLVAFKMLLSNFVGPINSLIGFNVQLQQANGHVSRLNDVFNTRIDPVVTAQIAADQAPTERAKGTALANPFRRRAAAPAVDAAPLRDLLTGRIELRNVSYAFTRLDPPFIRNVNMTIEPGERVALVGPSGSGKSTLLRLILGLYEPSEGEILYDGRPLTEIGRSAMVSSIAWVDQETILFAGTIFDNLTLWDPFAPWQAVVEAARDAAIHDTIMARPGAYEGIVDEGGRNFSGGQRQRLEIARALARQPSIIVLDEATSALDSFTEAAIGRNIQRRGITNINVAHRMSTIRDCEAIYVISNGEVVEHGGHRKLMHERGLYAELVGAR